MDKFLLIWITMTPAPEGVPGYDVTRAASGPFEEHTCRMMEIEQHELARNNPSPHAHIVYCAKLDPATAELLESINKRLETPKKKTAT